jgi:hypothetical protein
MIGSAVRCASLRRAMQCDLKVERMTVFMGKSYQFM